MKSFIKPLKAAKETTAIKWIAEWLARDLIQDEKSFLGRPYEKMLVEMLVVARKELLTIIEERKRSKSIKAN